MPKLKREEAGSLSKPERQKLQRLYTQGGAAYGSVRNLVKASSLSVSKVGQFLHSKHSYTKITLATREFKRMKAFARFKNEIRTVDAKAMKTKDSRETVRAFLTIITIKSRSENIWVDKGTEIAGDFKKLCKAEGIQYYSTMSETKAAFAERTIRSLKNILSRYMEDNGYKCIHKLTQFVTTLNFRRNCSIDLLPKNVKNSDLLSILYSKPLRKITKPQFNFGHRVRLATYDLPLRKGYKPQFTPEVFEIVAISSRKPPTYTIKDPQDEIIRGKFYQQDSIRVN